MSRYSVEFDRVTLRYRRHAALVDFSTRLTGGVVGILGPNGAGKTTLLQVLGGQLVPDAGRLTVNDEPVADASTRSTLRAACGYLPQDPHWLPGFTVAEFVTYFARLRMGHSAVTESVRRALETAGVGDLMNRPLGRLSGGERQRAFIAQAIVHQPEMLILDEPTAGLDPLQRIHLREVIAELGRERLVVLSSHLLEDLQQIATQIVIMDNGHCRWNGTPEALAAVGTTATSQGAISAAEAGLLSILHGDADADA